MDNLIALLAPIQTAYIPPNIDASLDEASSNDADLDLKNHPICVKYLGHLKADISVRPTIQHYSLYHSILTILSEKFNSSSYTYNHIIEMIEQTVQWISSKLQTEAQFKTIRPYINIIDIKNHKYQSTQIVWLLSIIFDLNIIVLTTDQIELYHAGTQYDNCKPHIILIRDDLHNYKPIIYGHHRLLTYHGHQIITELIDNHKSSIRYINQVLK